MWVLWQETFRDGPVIGWRNEFQNFYGSGWKILSVSRLATRVRTPCFPPVAGRLAFRRPRQRKWPQPQPCQSAIPSNNLTPTTTDSDWYTVTFATGPSCNFGPKIQVTGDAVAKIRVFTSCPSALATGLDCSEGGLSTKDGLSVWEFTYTGGIGACGSLNSIDPYPYYYGSFVTVATTVWIQVYATATTNSCGTYTVTVTN